MQWQLYPGKTSSITTAQRISSTYSEEGLFKAFMYFIKEGRKKYLLREEEVFDAYSDAVLQTASNIKEGKFENRSTIKTYLHRIFHNKCVDRLRKKSTKKEKAHQAVNVSDWLMAIPDPAKPVIEKLADQYDTELLKQRIEQLGENSKQLLMLFAEGYSDKEIATIMGYKSADVVKTTRLRCLDRLRRMYHTK